ncbi:hypothetical protein GCM10027089_15680 [Nocardia thraciensis]
MNDARAGPARRSDQPAIPRARAPNDPLTRTAILTAALEIIDSDSVGTLSMRRLGLALGHDPMVL